METPASLPEPAPTGGRPLGFAESFLHRFYTDLGAGLVTVAMARLEEAVPPDALAAAAGVVGRRHPLLRMRISRDADGSFHFTGASPLSMPVVRAASGDAGEVFEELVGSPFPPESLLWEVVLANRPGPHLFLKIHHALGDGTSGRSLLGEILRVAAGEDPGGGLSLRPCVEELVARSRGSFAEPLPAPSGGEPWRFAVEAPLAERACRVRFLETDAGPLAAAAHREGITVNSLLLATLVRAKRVLPGFPVAFSLILPIGVRRRLVPPIPDAEMGCLIGNALVHVPDEGADLPFAALAGILGRQLEHSLQTAITGPMDFDPAAVDAAVAPFADSTRNAFVFPLALSNLGVDPDPPPGVDALWFGASVKPGHLGILIAANTVRNRLCLSLSFTEPLLSAEAVDSFGKEISEVLSGGFG